MKVFFILSLLSFSQISFAVCRISASDGSLVTAKIDVLYETLSKQAQCPMRVQDLRAVFAKVGLRFEPSLVGNRGFHNPDLGSFSFFESVLGKTPDGREVGGGDFFLGHFTAEENGLIILDQAPAPGKLLVELIVKNYANGLYHFYEMIGNANGAEWFYRGDSLDILKDNTWVHRKPPTGAQNFGKLLRCSGCHSSGGPILKELAAPHNDWWTEKRKLPFGKNRLSPEVSDWMSRTKDVKAIAAFVKKGIDSLNESIAYRAARAKLSLQERLRPLFCENEINLESDRTPLDGDENDISIPSGFLIHPLLGEVSLSVAKSDYRKWLAEFELYFPETNRSDADHAWLTPVVAYSDIAEIKQLMLEKLIDEEFVADVLAIDSSLPLFSKSRCGLLKEIPESATNWRAVFEANLKISSAPAAKELVENLSDEKRNAKFHRENAEKLAEATDKKAAFLKLLTRRQLAFQSEISKNPRGQILEPGFRVIFPVPANQ